MRADSPLPNACRIPLPSGIRRAPCFRRTLRTPTPNGHRTRLTNDIDIVAGIAAPEDVIIKKMEYYREGGSEKHLRDITGILLTTGADIDRPYNCGAACIIVGSCCAHDAQRVTSLGP